MLALLIHGAFKSKINTPTTHVVIDDVMRKLEDAPSGCVMTLLTLFTNSISVGVKLDNCCSSLTKLGSMLGGDVFVSLGGELGYTELDGIALGSALDIPLVELSMLGEILGSLLELS